MNNILPMTALAIACATSPLTSANDKLEEVVVISSRVPMPLRQIGTSVSVIGAEEIQQRGFNSLFEILRSQPAVAVSNTGGAGKVSSLRIRGEEGYRTRVYMDGIDISDVSGTQSGPRLEHIMSAGIQRVEILRGPQGLMYGADAGGVVNIMSEALRDDFGGNVNVEGGRYDTRQLAANLGGGTDTFDYSLSVSDFETEGFNSRTDDTVLRDKDGYESTTVHGRVGWNITEALRLQLVAREVSGENEYDNCYGTGPSNLCNDDFEQSAWRAQAEYNAGAFTNELAYSGNETEREHFVEGDSSFGSVGELDRWSYLGSFAANDALRLVYGADFETSSSDDGFNKNERDQDGYFAEYQGNFSDAFYLTAGLRYDDNEDFGDHTSYRLSGAYLFGRNGGDLKLKAAYGTGFRAPSLGEIAYNDRPGVYPPASEVTLKEETSAGYDIGLSWYGDSGLYLEAVYFDQTISDITSHTIIYSTTSKYHFRPIT